MSVAGTPILITAYTHGKRIATQKLTGLSRFHSASQSRSSLNSWFGGEADIESSTALSAIADRTLECTINCACRCRCLRVYYTPHNAGCVGMTKAVLMALLLSVGLSAPAAAVKQYQRYGDPRPGGVWNDGPFACLPGRSCNCHPDTYVAIRCERTSDGPQCWWNSNCYCEPPIGSQYCGSRSGDWPAFRKRPKASMRFY